MSTSSKEALFRSMEQARSVRVAVCGNLPTACKTLRDAGVCHIDKFSDAMDLTSRIKDGHIYHLILVYAPQGEGLDIDIPCFIKNENNSGNIPVKLLNEPACNSALIELKLTVRHMAQSCNECISQ